MLNVKYKTIALSTFLVGNNIAILTILETAPERQTVAISTVLLHWLLHAPYDNSNQGIIGEPPKPTGGGSRF